MSIRNLQQPDGSFLPIHIGAETRSSDSYIVLSYDGGFGDDFLVQNLMVSVAEHSYMRQSSMTGGFQGRANKPSDTMLMHFVWWVSVKFPNQLPDLYHSYYGYTGTQSFGRAWPLCTFLAELGNNRCTSIGSDLPTELVFEPSPHLTEESRLLVHLGLQ
ncbi:hypothetical protein NC653_022214 [Populus alba x Populus x berolinensis]|uniref:Prenyltransferase alpha-alpha toroid domain-containing protein n=1 Tax=Populus alba x Populus x berolinensis TaxID=444605 RepID=A0AAD6QFS2_9ROSI|nr:hypothetical protein NC653_022214 [Populus alba x Populus x berolinensis]